MRILIALACLLLISLPARAAATYDPQHAAFTQLLAKHVRWSTDGHTTAVDYAGFKTDRAALKAYLDALATVPQAEFERWTPAQRNAFLINAYNGWTVELILTRYPDLESIKDLGGFFSSPWKQSIAQLLGQPRTLDDIEHGLLRGAADFAEPRIHFAVNCASIGCPALRPEAYTAEAFDAQLEDQTKRFMSDRSRNRASADGTSLEVSKLFDWYAADFVAAESQLPAPRGFLLRYVESLSDNPAAIANLRSAKFKLGFLDYDWALNATKQP